MGHGRTLLGLTKKRTNYYSGGKGIKEGLNVRQLEKLIQKLNEDVPRETKKPKRKKIYF